VSVRLRILQASDFHLCSRPPGAAGLAPEVRLKIQEALLEAFRGLCRLAGEEGVDAVIVPGDLFDGESAEDRLLGEVIVALRSCPCPVLVTPGNHDYYSPAGFWSPQYLEPRSLAWPDNLTLFTEASFGTLDLPGAADRATATGICYREPSAPGEGLDAVPPGDGRIHLLVFHGSLTGHSWPDKSYPLPFRREELLGLGFDYAALGHYHGHLEVRDGGGQVRGAYGGIPQPRRHSEQGETGALLIEIEKEGDASRVRSSLRPLARHRFLTVPVEVSGIQAATEAKKRIREALEGSGAGADDLVRVVLEGVVPPGVTPEDLAACAEGAPVLHLEVRAGGVLPDYPLEAPGGGEEVTVEDIFRTRMRARLEEALSRGDEAEAARVRRAFGYGMDALVRGEVTARHVD